MKLTYTPKPGVACPGDGWPARDHEESDPKLAAKKVASGFYRRPNAKEQREAERERAASKALANAKFQEAASEEIAAADGAVEAAKETAARTRQRLGKEE